MPQKQLFFYTLRLDVKQNHIFLSLSFLRGSNFRPNLTVIEQPVMKSLIMTIAYFAAYIYCTYLHLYWRF